MNESLLSDPYYQFTPHRSAIGGVAYDWFARRGMGASEESLTAAELLAETLALAPDARVLCMHCGAGLPGAVAARQAHRGRATLLDCNVVAVEAARRALAANRIANAEVFISDCGQRMLNRSSTRGDGQAFDAVLALLPKGRAVWEQTILDAAALLRVGGAFYLAGATRAGIKSASKYVRQVFGAVDVVTYRSRCRVLRAVVPPGLEPPGSDYYAWRTCATRVGEQDLEWVTKPGLFSWQQLDDGTRLLIEALQDRPLPPETRVLDVGCGAGVLAAVAARQAPQGQVAAVDVDCRAVEATRRTLALNGLSHAAALAGDCMEAVADRTFDVVLTNPPFHRQQATTYAVAGQIIRDAARVLVRHGRLYLVANRFLKYEPLIEEAFGRARLLRETSSYRVWSAEK